MTDSSGPSTGGGSFFATVLIVVGLLWMALAGLCSGAVLFSSLMGGDLRLSDLMSNLPIVLIFGTIGAAPGLLIWLGGRGLRNRRNSERR